MKVRGLARGELELAAEAFGTAIDLDRVRFLAAPRPFTRAFVPGRWFGRDWIVWPDSSLPADFGEAPLYRQETFVHELTHVWQAQHGVNLLTGKIRAGDKPSSYEYPTGMDCEWGQLNIEQQAMVVQHRFSLTRGLKTPATREFYGHVCPLNRERFTALFSS
jgi:hypothetical protein